MEVDPIGFNETECFITASQENTLSTATFAREESFFDDGDDDGVNDTWPESSDDEGGAIPDTPVVGITICSAPPTPEPNQPGSPVDLGFSREIKSVRECSAVTSSSPTATATAKELRISDNNDSVSGNPDELGFLGERKGAREKSVMSSPPTTAVTATPKELRNPCEIKRVRECSSPTATAKKLRFSEANDGKLRGLTDFSDAVSGNPDDLRFKGESKGAREKSVMSSPTTTATATAKKLNFSEANDGNQQDSEEEVVSEEWKSPVFGTEQVSLSDDDDEEGVATVVIAEEEEEEIKDATVDRNAKPESYGEGMECVIQVLRLLSESNRSREDGGNVDFLETAKRRGYTFPPRRTRLP